MDVGSENGRHPPVKHSNLALKCVATLLVLPNLVIAYLMAVVAYVGNPFAAMVYAPISLGWISLLYWLLKRASHPRAWAAFLVLGGMISFGMLSFANWLLMAFAGVS